MRLSVHQQSHTMIPQFCPKRRRVCYFLVLSIIDIKFRFVTIYSVWNFQLDFVVFSVLFLDFGISCVKRISMQFNFQFFKSFCDHLHIFFLFLISFRSFLNGVLSDLFLWIFGAFLIFRLDFVFGFYTSFVVVIKLIWGIDIYIIYPSYINIYFIYLDFVCLFGWSERC